MANPCKHSTMCSLLASVGMLAACCTKTWNHSYMHPVGISSISAYMIEDLGSMQIKIVNHSRQIMETRTRKGTSISTLSGWNLPFPRTGYILRSSLREPLGCSYYYLVRRSIPANQVWQICALRCGPDLPAGRGDATRMHAYVTPSMCVSRQPTYPGKGNIRKLVRSSNE